MRAYIKFTVWTIGIAAWIAIVFFAVPALVSMPDTAAVILGLALLFGSLGFGGIFIFKKFQKMFKGDDNEEN
jgi:hypothetical protein